VAIAVMLFKLLSCLNLELDKLPQAGTPALIDCDQLIRVLDKLKFGSFQSNLLNS